MSTETTKLTCIGRTANLDDKNDAHRP